MGGTFSVARAINDAGQIAGWADTPNGLDVHPFLYGDGVMTDLGTLGGSSGFVNAMNAAGQVVGLASIGHVDGHDVYHAFLYGNGVMMDLGTLGGSTSEALDVNDAGEAVGYAYLADDGTHHAFLYSDGVMHDLGTLGGSYSTARAVNAAGQVVGDSAIAGDQAVHAFLYTDGAMIDLDTTGGEGSTAVDINDAGDVVGSVATAEDFREHAFLYRDGVLTELGAFAGGSSEAAAVNEAAEVVGWSAIDAQGTLHPFLYSDGVMQDLGTLGGSSGIAVVIDDAGHVGGHSFLPGDTLTHPFVYRDGTMHDLGTLGGRIANVLAINALGQVVGQSETTTPNVFHAFLSRVCGDGVIDPGETCEDGNDLDGDGCSHLCAAEEGWHCDGTPSVCHHVAPCAAVPRDGCRRPTASKASVLVVEDHVRDQSDVLRWSWTKGAATATADFGDPRATTAYSLCVYEKVDATPELRVSAIIPPGGTCTRKRPCWKATAHGFRYTDPGGSQDGVTSVELRAGSDRKAAVTFRARGTALDLPSAPFTPTSQVLVQLVNDAGTCWEASFSAPASKNVHGQFRDRSD